MIKLEAQMKELSFSNCLGIVAGTNCPKGGDSGHGGRTYLRIENLGGTDMSVRLDKSGLFNQVEAIEIMLGGDSECETLIDALKFALRILENQFKGSEENVKSLSIELP